MKTLSMRRKAVYEQGIIPFEEYNIPETNVDKIEELLRSCAKYDNEGGYLVPLNMVKNYVLPLFIRKDKTLLFQSGAESITSTLIALEKAIEDAYSVFDNTQVYLLIYYIEGDEETIAEAFLSGFVVYENQIDSPEKKMTELKNFGNNPLLRSILGITYIFWWWY